MSPLNKYLLAGAIVFSGSSWTAPSSLYVHGKLFLGTGVPVDSGTYVKVILWKDATSTAGGDKIWDPGSCISVTPASDGRFVYTIDFSSTEIETLANLSTGDQLWAEISVGVDASCSSAASPRMKVQGSAYAVAVDVTENALVANAVTGNVLASQLVVMTGASGGSAGVAGAVPAPAAGEHTKFLRGDGTWQTMAGMTSSGTVTSVGLSMPAEFSVTGSPVIDSGTLAVSWADQSPHLIFAGPASGGADVPTFRSLAEADLPDLSFSQITTGALPVSMGGLGDPTLQNVFQTLGLGTLSAYNSTSAYLTGGTLDGVSINTSYSATFAGFESNLASGKLWIGNASSRSEARTVSGDATLDSSGQMSVVGIQGRAVSSTAPGVGEVLYWNGAQSRWDPGTPSTSAPALVGVSSGVSVLSAGSRYLTQGASRLTLKLPSACSLGDQIEVMGQGAGGWKLAPSLGSTLYLDNGESVLSPATLDSPNRRSAVNLVCSNDDDNLWSIVSSNGLTGVTATPGLPYDLSAKFANMLPEEWVSAGVNPTNAQDFYATTMSSHVYGSTDQGASWSLFCTLSSNAGNGSRLRFAPNGTVYSVTASGLFVVSDQSGAACTPITMPTGYIWNMRYLDFDSSGNLYVWMNKDAWSGHGYLYQSTNQGSSWSLVYTDNSDARTLGRVAVDPFDATKILVYRAYSSAAFNLSTDSGANFSTVLSGVTLDSSSSAAYGSDTFVGPIYDPVHQNWIYTNMGVYSSDGGSTWSSSSSYSNPDRPMILDPSGAGYRVTISGVTLGIDKTSDMTSPSWSSLSAQVALASSNDVYTAQLDAVSGSIVLAVGHKLFFSDDDGSTLQEVTGIINPGAPEIVSVESPDGGSTLYAIDGHWNIYKSTDGGQAWVLKYQPSTVAADHTPLLWATDANTVYARSETWNSTYSYDFMSSVDGFATASETNNAGIYSWASAWAAKVSDPLVMMGIANSSSLLTTNGLLPFSSVSGPSAFIWYPWVKNYINPQDTNITWYGEGAWNGSGSGMLWEYDRTTHASTDISSRVGMTNMSGMESFALSGGGYMLRVVGPNGQVSESTDAAQNFSLKTLTTPITGTCSIWTVSSHPGNHDIMAVACAQGGTYYAYTLDGGVHWTSKTASDCSSVGIWNIAVTDLYLILSCADGGYTNNAGYTAGPYAIPY